MGRRNILAISLPNDLTKKLSYEAKQEHTSRSEIIRRSLRQHFFARDFSKARNKILRELDRKGIHWTEDEIFEQVS